jgi:hypothetical protein
VAKLYYGFMIDPEMADALKLVKERDGVPEGEQIRRALRQWFKGKGIDVTPETKPPTTRRGHAKTKGR